MKKLFLITSLIYSFYVSASFRDIAVFKVSDQIYFASDLKKISNEIQSFHCAYPESILFKVLNSQEFINKNKLFEVPEKLEAKDWFIQNRSAISELRKFLKLKLYAKNNIGQEAKENKDLKVLFKKSKCFPEKNNLDEVLTEFIQMEIFYKSRYQSLKNDTNDSKDAFFKTIDRQFAHEDLF